MILYCVIIQFVTRHIKRLFLWYSIQKYLSDYLCTCTTQTSIFASNASIPSENDSYHEAKHRSSVPSTFYRTQKRITSVKQITHLYTAVHYTMVWSTCTFASLEYQACTRRHSIDLNCHVRVLHGTSKNTSFSLFLYNGGMKNPMIRHHLHLFFKNSLYNIVSKYP